MPNFAGYLQLRRAIFEHIRDGRLTKLQALAYIYVASQADTRTGVWTGSAGALSGEFCCSERSARHLLESLSKHGYLRRFPTPGRHFCYPILVNKYLVTDGEHAGKRLNASASKSWQHLVYEKNGDFGEHRGEHRGEQSAPQRRIEKREERRKNPAATKTSPPDPRHAIVFRSCHEAFESHHGGQKPTWGAKEGRRLSDFLREHPSLEAVEIVRRYRNLLGSTAHFHAEKHGSLLHLLSNFDVFMDGPIFDRVTGGTNGNGNGRPNADPNERTRLRMRAGFAHP